MIDQHDDSAIHVKRQMLTQTFSGDQNPDQGVFWEKCSRASTTPIRTITLTTNPTAKQNPAA
jgi:hypothetical protein